MIHLKLYKKVIVVSFILPFIFFGIAIAQNNSISEFEYISPISGSGMNLPETNIIVRYGPAFSTNDVYSEKLIEVSGDKSGLHSGKIILTENNRTLLFNPDSPFQEGEVVNVKFLRSPKTEDDQTVPTLSFYFKITENDINKFVQQNLEKYLIHQYPELASSSITNSRTPISNNHRYTVMEDSLPDDFPQAVVDSIDNPTPGYIFYAPFIFPGFLPTYLIISDNYGTPIYYKKPAGAAFDFKRLDTGELTYFELGQNQYYLLDSSYNVIDSLYMQNGYVTDLHDIIVLENRHSFLMSYDYQQVPMDTVVPGGDPDATVIGIILQELDENKNVVFQWRSWDHYQITDATYDINLTDSLVDYAHSNSIEIDFDDNILLSTRHFDEVTKIDRQTGDIIWRWGGEHCENNEFTFLNDPIGFSHQHDARRLPNGNITIFDNGNLHNPQFSRVAEYQIDEVNKLATLIWEYRNEPETYSVAMGDARRLYNHNTIVGWGTGTSPAISEVKADGTVSLFLSINDTLLNYRAFKFPWKTNLFVGNPESLVFGYVPLGDSLQLSLDIINNSNQEIEINGVFNRDSVYSVNALLPIILPPFESANVTVQFKPEIDGDYFDDLHLRWDTEGQRIAQVIPLIGSTDPNFTSVDPEEGLMEYTLSQNYPNPFNPATTIAYQIPQMEFVSVKVYDILGKEVATLVNEEKPAGNYEVQFNSHSGEVRNLTSGIYFYRLQAGSFVETKKMIFLK